MKPTPAKKIDPTKKNKDPIIAKINVDLFSLNNRGTSKKDIHTRKNNIIDKLKRIKETIFLSPE